MILPEPETTTTISVLRAVSPADLPVLTLATIERHGPRTLLVLEDGVTLDFDALEFAAAARPSLRRARAA